MNCVKLTQGEDCPDQRAPAQPPARHRPGQHGPQHKQGGVVETRNINIETRNFLTEDCLNVVLRNILKSRSVLD